METSFLCPYCGSENSIFIEPSDGEQHSLISDCETCCKPINIRVIYAAGKYHLDARQTNE